MTSVGDLFGNSSDCSDFSPVADEKVRCSLLQSADLPSIEKGDSFLVDFDHDDAPSASKNLIDPSSQMDFVHSISSSSHNLTQPEIGDAHVATTSMIKRTGKRRLQRNIIDHSINHFQGSSSLKVKKRQIDKQDHLGQTKLHRACNYGDVAATRRLIEREANLNIQDHEGWTALHEACLCGHTNIVAMLLDAGAHVNLHGLNQDTALHYASASGDEDMVRLLLSHGASPHAKNSKHLRPIDVCSVIPADSGSQATSRGSASKSSKSIIYHLLKDALTTQDAASHTALHTTHEHLNSGNLALSKSRDSSLAKVNVEKSASTIKTSDLNARSLLNADMAVKSVKRDKSGQTELHLAASNGDLDRLAVLLGQHPIQQGDALDVNVQDYAGWTPLHEAVLNNQTDVARLLLQHGAQVDSLGAGRVTPLHDAAYNLNVEMCRLLVEEHQASVSIKNSKGQSALDLALALVKKNEREQRGKGVTVDEDAQTIYSLLDVRSKEEKKRMTYDSVGQTTANIIPSHLLSHSDLPLASSREAKKLEQQIKLINRLEYTTYTVQPTLDNASLAQVQNRENKVDKTKFKRKREVGNDKDDATSEDKTVTECRQESIVSSRTTSGTLAASSTATDAVCLLPPKKRRYHLLADTSVECPSVERSVLSDRLTADQSKNEDTESDEGASSSSSSDGEDEEKVNVKDDRATSTLLSLARQRTLSRIASYHLAGEKLERRRSPLIVFHFKQKDSEALDKSIHRAHSSPFCLQWQLHYMCSVEDDASASTKSIYLKDIADHLSEQFSFWLKHTDHQTASQMLMKVKDYLLAFAAKSLENQEKEGSQFSDLRCIFLPDALDQLKMLSKDDLSEEILDTEQCHVYLPSPSSESSGSSDCNKENEDVNINQSTSASSSIMKEELQSYNKHTAIHKHEAEPSNPSVFPSPTIAINNQNTRLPPKFRYRSTPLSV